MHAWPVRNSFSGSFGISVSPCLCPLVHVSASTRSSRRGGIGEVYRARDTKLGRSVAIKVLLEAVATHTDRIARFEIAHGALFVR